ncbi:MAG: S8 family peptidase [Erysipelotrichaceae bacterium]
MNALLNIKLPFNYEKNSKRPGPRNLKTRNKVNNAHIDKLIDDLENVKNYYEHINRVTEDILIDAVYNDIVAKSNRITEILKNKGDCNNNIVGARFSEAENHIITYYVPLTVIDKAIEKLNDSKQLITNQLNGEANSVNFDYGNTSIKYPGNKRLKIRNTIIDCSVLESFGIPDAGSVDFPLDNVSITFFSTELKTSILLSKIIKDNRLWYETAGENTIIASKDTYKYLYETVPYLISMASSDISRIEPLLINNKNKKDECFIPSPGKEPVIGVIDAVFKEDVYFSDWVEYVEYLDFLEKSTVKEKDYEHGTAVSSLIVDGPSLNPWLDDGLGRFRVRHFGVCANRISPTKLIRKIEEIIQKNKDIRVFNLSLGTEYEVSKNFISFDGARLDALQKEYNVIFVVAGTNDTRTNKEGLIRIGSPADSLNSVVVNSVKKDGTPASYTRNGKVLSFFNKPDVSYYGGDYENDERIAVYTSKGIDMQYGTSFAAPWIARKLCYLINIMGYPKEVAKALIIDSAAGWEYKQNNYKYQNIIGYGIVPIKMDSILSTDNSEIKFILHGSASKYLTSNYAIPVPKDNDKCAYIARATLCYFPLSNRLEGIDYTQRELSLKFGRMNEKGIVDINHNVIDVDGEYTDERRSRMEFRKWENTKFISSLLKENGNRLLKSYGDGLWGVSLTSMERGRIAKHEELLFGLVICLKNIKGENKINEFKHNCLLRGYIVNEVNINNQIYIFEKAQNEVEFE